jgi:hypothetical protein
VTWHRPAKHVAFSAVNGRNEQEEALDTVTVRVPRNLTLDQAHKVVANVLGKLGHLGCFSGFDIRFTNAVDYYVSAANLEVHEVER